MKVAGLSGRAAVAAGALMLVTACNTTNPEAVQTIAQPKTPVAKTLTSFTQAKSCMDQLFRQYGKTNILLTSDGIPDKTGSISAGTRDMMIKALDDMSQSSRAFRFYDLDLNNQSVVIIQDSINARGELPPFYIRGSISQVDRNVTSDSIGGSVSLPFVSIGASKDQIASIITIDLQVGDLVRRQVLSGVTTTNTITVVSKGRGLSADGLINRGAVSINLDNYTEEGTGQAVRTLLDYSLIELMGKFTKVPYERCLELDSTSPTVLANHREEYDGLTAQQKTQAIQRALVTAGEYTGTSTGVDSRQFRDALNVAKSRRNLIPNGRVDFEIYTALASEGYLVPGAASDANVQPVLARPGSGGTSFGQPVRPGGHDPLGLHLMPPDHALHVGDTVSLTASVEQPAYLYCYYGFQDNGRPVVARIFPNRFQSDNRLSPGQTVQIPGQSNNFSIELAQPGVEETIGCIATAIQYPARDKPEAARERDLTPLRSANTVSAVIDQHLEADRNRSSVKVARLLAR